MDEREALLQAVCDHLDDDTPRLVLADWLEENGEPERAEFIRAQVAAAHAFERGESLEGNPNAIRADELERVHGSRWWFGTPPARHGVTFGMWRGFPFQVSALDGRALRLAEHSPPGIRTVEYLFLGELWPHDIGYLARRRYVPRIRLLQVGRVGRENLLRGLLSDTDWSGLRYLSLQGCDLSCPSTAAVADYPGFTSLKVLDLRSTGIGNAGVAALCGSTTLNGLVRLRLGGNDFLEMVHDDLRARFGDRVEF